MPAAWKIAKRFTPACLAVPASFEFLSLTRLRSMTRRRKTRIEGNPDPKHVSTSFAERHNLNMRMQMRRFTRLTTGYSKKIENHMHMVALYTVWYNWIRTHKAHRVTPAMAAGLTSKLMDMLDVARLIDDAEMRATIQQRAAALALPQSN
jgi:hypothetical protein